MSEDVRPVPTGDIRLTYVQLGARLGISAEAARVLTRRRGWQRIHPNRRGAPALVVVPEDELAGELWREQRTTPDDTGTSPDVHQDTRADKAEQRADAAERRADEANVRADRALALAADAAARADRIESPLSESVSAPMRRRARLRLRYGRSRHCERRTTRDVRCGCWHG